MIFLKKLLLHFYYVKFYYVKHSNYKVFNNFFEVQTVLFKHGTIF